MEEYDVEGPPLTLHGRGEVARCRPSSRSHG